MLDANVLLQAPLRDTLLRAAEAGLFLPHWSATILDEVRRHFAAVSGKHPESARRVRYLLEQLAAAFPDALVTTTLRPVPALQADPGDQHVLAAALAAQAGWIVTHNLRHFPRIVLAPYGLVAASPDTFLTMLHERDPERLPAILAEQGADLHPPRDVDALLDILTPFAPSFVGLMREVSRRAGG